MSKQSKRRRSPVVIVGQILLILAVLGGASIGIDRIQTGVWPWNTSHPPKQPKFTVVSIPTPTVAHSHGWGVQTFDVNMPVPPPWGLTAITWSGSQFVAVGTNGVILTSSNERTWVVQTSNGQSTTPFQVREGLSAVAWSGTRFVAVGANDFIVTSTDGRNWTVQTSGASFSSLESIVWSGSEFVAVGTGGLILTSPDGITWTIQTSGTSSDLSSIIWSGSQFVAVGLGGLILTSPDGITWTIQTSGTSSDLNSVAWSGSQFIIVGYKGTILISPDGITWTKQELASDEDFSAIAGSGSYFVAVGIIATKGDILLTSLNGRSWTVQQESIDLEAVIWLGSHFVVIGENEGLFLTPP